MSVLLILMGVGMLLAIREDAMPVLVVWDATTLMVLTLAAAVLWLAYRQRLR